MQYPGKLISFEGGEGSGKSTALYRLIDKMKEAGIEPVVTREPGGTPLGEIIRELLLDPLYTGMSASTEFNLYQASRAQLVHELIKPALVRGELVLADRFFDSSIAYQGGARRLGIDKTIQRVLEATQGISPDTTFLFDIDPKIGFQRISRELDRLEQESLEFHESVRSTYLAISHRFPERVLVIDASQSQEEVYKELKQKFQERTNLEF